MSSRRQFIKLAGTGAGIFLPFTFKAITDLPEKGRIRFGIIADPHRDIVPDADRRLEAFMEQAERETPDFIINLGDFCFGKTENKPFLKRFQQFAGPSYHVLGNHDMDYNTKEEMVDFLGMQDRYYSFDILGFHFIVLDANNLYQDGRFIGYGNANFYVDDKYREFIDEEQIEWFKADLENTQKPVIVFSHQSLFHYTLGIKNRLSIQLLMEQENRKAGYKKIIACFNGHDHMDFHREINGIYYFDINSMAYQWYNTQNLTRYPKEMYEKYRHLGNMAMYKDPLFAFVTIENRTMQVKGVRSEWVSPSPYEAGVPREVYGNESHPCISDVTVKW